MIDWWKIIFDKNDLTYLSKNFRKKKISEGTVNNFFEKKIAKFLNVKYCITANSGTSAFYIALNSLGLKKSDEIIVPNRTWLAAPNVIHNQNFKIVLCDTRKDIPSLCFNDLKKKTNKKTKLIIATHLNGRVGDFKKILNFANKKKIRIIEDTAQALGSKISKKYLGTFGEIGFFSMALTKIISTGQGGFAVTNNKKLYLKMRSYKNQGIENPFQLKWNKTGLNFKFTDMQASIGITQLKKFKEKKKNLIKIYKFYEKELKKIKFIKLIPVSINNNEIPLWIECLVDDRKNFIQFMKKNNVIIRPSYPSLNRMKILNSNKYKFKNSEIFEKKGVFLPTGVDRDINEIKKVISSLKKFK